MERNRRTHAMLNAQAWRSARDGGLCRKSFGFRQDDRPRHPLASAMTRSIPDGRQCDARGRRERCGPALARDIKRHDQRNRR